MVAVAVGSGMGVSVGAAVGSAVAVGAVVAVGSAVGAVPEILETCGLIVPPGNVEALAQAMRRMYEDTALFTRLRAAAGPAGEAYSPKKRLDLVESIYAELLRRKGLL